MVDLYLRQENRYQLTAPVSYWWSCSKGQIREGSGVTRNISQAGVLVVTNECPPAGTPIQIAVFLPRLQGEGHGMKLHGEGTVLRVEDAEASAAKKGAESFAAAVRFYPELSASSGHTDSDGIEKLGTAVH